MAYGNENAVRAERPPVGEVEGIRNTVCDLQQRVMGITQGLRENAGRILGNVPEPTSGGQVSAPKAVANGGIEELRESLAILEGEIATLNSVASRFSRL